MIEPKIGGQSQLLISPGWALFVGSVLDTEIHRHHAIQLVVGVDRDFSLRISGEEIVARSVLLNSNLPHCLNGSQGRQVLILVEPELGIGQALKARMPAAWQFFPAGPSLVAGLLALFEKPDCLNPDLPAWLLGQLGGKASCPVPDERIARVIAVLRETTAAVPRLEELADLACLSVSRLQHLFKLQTGVSLKRFALWTKMLSGISLVQQGLDFTAAAHTAGFADSAHMSRSFKEMFGINLSQLFKSSISIQAIPGSAAYTDSRRE